MTRDAPPVVLVVDDQPGMRALCTQVLQPEFRTLEASNGQEALRQLYSQRPVLVLLDINMPVMDGWETLRRIRDLTSVPVILITSRDTDLDVTRGLDGGAQDYIVKPFSPAQLKARVRAAIRDHASAPIATDELLSFSDGQLVIDVGRRLVIVRGQEIELSATEYKLLELLARHAGRVLSQEQILERVWGPEYRDEPSYVRTYVGFLRRKIETDPADPQYLLSRRGLGYLLNVRR